MLKGNCQKQQLRNSKQFLNLNTIYTNETICRIVADGFLFKLIHDF